MDDLREMELDFDFTLLPNIARNSDNIKVFSQQEEYDYLIQNGMHNKKQSKQVSKQIQHLKNILS